MNNTNIEPTKYDLYDSLETIINEVLKEKFLTLEMGQLREAYGVKRLGKNVREQIANELNNRGISTLPEEIPDSQSADIRLYDTRSEIGVLIKAVLTPNKHHDSYLRDILENRAGPTADVYQKMATSLIDMSDELMSMAKTLKDGGG